MGIGIISEMSGQPHDYDVNWAGMMFRVAEEWFRDESIEIWLWCRFLHGSEITEAHSREDRTIYGGFECDGKHIKWRELGITAIPCRVSAQTDWRLAVALASPE